MNKENKAILLGVLMAVAPTVCGQGFNSVVIHNYDGTDHRIAIDGDALNVSLNGNAIRLSNTGITVEYDIPEVKHFEFEYYKFDDKEYYLGTKTDVINPPVEPQPFDLKVWPADGAEIAGTLRAISFAHIGGMATEVTGNDAIALTCGADTIIQWTPAELTLAYDAETYVYTLGGLSEFTPGVYGFHIPEKLVSESEMPVNMNRALNASFTISKTENRLMQTSMPTITFRVDGGRLVVNGLKAPGRAVIFGIDGTEAASATVTAFGAATIDISSLGHGAYLLNADGKSFKISF